jgi:hypothetical protein
LISNVNPLSASVFGGASYPKTETLGGGFEVGQTLNPTPQPRRA